MLHVDCRNGHVTGSNLGVRSPTTCFLGWLSVLLVTATARCWVDMYGMQSQGSVFRLGIGRGHGIGVRGSDGPEENEGDDGTWSN